MLNIKNILLTLAGTLLISINTAHATDYKFADTETAIKILTANDEFLTMMNPIEIALRVGSPVADKTIEDLKAHYRDNVIEWPAAEKALMKALLVTHKKKLAKIAHLLPDTVYFIKVTDKVESGIRGGGGGGGGTHAAMLLFPLLGNHPFQQNFFSIKFFIFYRVIIELNAPVFIILSALDHVISNQLRKLPNTTFATPKLHSPNFSYLLKSMIKIPL